MWLLIYQDVAPSMEVISVGLVLVVCVPLTVVICKTRRN